MPLFGAGLLTPPTARPQVSETTLRALHRLIAASNPDEFGPITP